MNQNQFAQILGWPTDLIASAEAGTQRIGASRLAVIAKALDVKVTYFFEGASPPREIDQINLEDSDAEPDYGGHDQHLVELINAFVRIAGAERRDALLVIAKIFATNKQHPSAERIKEIIANLAAN